MSVLRLIALAVVYVVLFGALLAFKLISLYVWIKIYMNVKADISYLRFKYKLSRSGIPRSLAHELEKIYRYSLLREKDAVSIKKLVGIVKKIS